MPILDKLNKMDPDELVSVGTKNGGAYMFIGTVAEAKDKLNDIFESAKENKERRLKMHMNERNKLVRSGVPGRSKATIAEIDKFSNTLTELQKMINQLDRYLFGYTPAMTRRVVETYYKAVDGSTAIIISGTEYGPHWFENDNAKTA